MNWKDFLTQAKAIVDYHRSEAPEGYDPQNIGVALGVTAAAVVAAGATAYSASSASSSQAAANATNAQNVQNTNQLNYNEFLQSRGSNGYSILPMYAKDANGNPIEPQLFSDANAVYDATAGLPPAQQIAANQAIVNQTAGAQQGANETANGIFNGNLRTQEQSNYAPVAAANLQAVQTQKQGTLEALQGTLNNIKAIQAGKGYSGDSFGSQLLQFGARQNANTTAANATSAANITNATNVNAINQNAINRQLSNLNTPTTMANQNITLSNLANNTALTNSAQRLSLLNNFKIGTGNFQYQNLPYVSPNATTGQIVSNAVGGVANSGGNYLSNLALINQLNGNSNGNYPGSSGNNGSLLPGYGNAFQPGSNTPSTDVMGNPAASGPATAGGQSYSLSADNSALM